MKIQWNKVTWYSKLLAIILFTATFALAFNLGREYERITEYNAVRENGNIEQDNARLELSVGKLKQFNGMTFELMSVTEDSRCPADVMCIQMGKAVASIAIRASGRTQTISISSNGEKYAIENYSISIERVLPYPYSNTTIGQKDYVVTVHVDRMK